MQEFIFEFLFFCHFNATTFTDQSSKLNASSQNFFLYICLFWVIGIAVSFWNYSWQGLELAFRYGSLHWAPPKYQTSPLSLTMHKHSCLNVGITQSKVLKQWIQFKRVLQIVETCEYGQNMSENASKSFSEFKGHLHVRLSKQQFEPHFSTRRTYPGSWKYF